MRTSPVTSSFLEGCSYEYGTLSLELKGNNVIYYTNARRYNFERLLRTNSVARSSCVDPPSPIISNNWSMYSGLPMNIGEIILRESFKIVPMCKRYSHCTTVIPKLCPP